MAGTPQIQEQTQQFLSFHLPPGAQALLPTEHLTEILSLTPSQIVPIPDTLPAVMGVCNWRGEVLWLVDLGSFLGFEPLHAQGSHHTHYSVIVIHHQGKIIGLTVNQVGQMVWCDPAQIQSPPTQITPQLTVCLQGCWLRPTGELFLVLNGMALIESFRKQTDADPESN